MARLVVHRFAAPLGAGVGVPILAIHGVKSHGRRFRRLAEEAWPERTTLAVDLRGHGASTWDPPWDVSTHVADLLETLDAEGVERVAVVGHSFGGCLATHLAAAAPDRVERFVLLDPAVALPPSRVVARPPASLAGFGGPGLLLVAGREDYVTPALRAALQRDLGPRLTVRSIDAGHMLFWDAFEATAEIVAPFLRQSGDTEGSPMSRAASTMRSS